MRHKQAKPLPTHKKYRVYSPSAMLNAFQAVKDKTMYVKSAARQYNVPQTTLRDRVMGRIDPETLSSGPNALFSQEEEAIFISHLKRMAELGYGYTRMEVLDQATNYAISLCKRDKEHPLSDRWYRGLMGRWPELKLLKPRSLAKCRAQSTSESTIVSYFTNLENTLKKLDLLNKPECIYNIDEKGVQTEHTPPYIVCAENCTPAITSARSSNTTILGCGNALGTQIPPFFVFKGNRMRADLLDGASPGVQGTMSETGWSNSSVFLENLETHFFKYVQRPSTKQPILLVFDGHKSHITISVIDWAKEHNIHLFVLPAHTSHILQPLDVGCFGPLQKIYNAACHKFLRSNPASCITRNNICSIVCSAYMPALSATNLISAYKRTGIYPFNPKEISALQLTPSKAYSIQDDTDSQHLQANSFFSSAEKVIKNKQSFETKQRKDISRIVSGTEITSHSIETQIVDYQLTVNKKTKSIKKLSVPSSSTQPYKLRHVCSPQPVPLTVEDSELSSDDEMLDDEVCCVCQKFQPKELQHCISQVYTKWAQCDHPSCKHWTHLKYCCKQSVIRLHDTFICPCHNEN